MIVGQGLVSVILLGNGRRRRSGKLFQLSLDGSNVGIHHLVQQAGLQDVELFAVLAESAALEQRQFVG